MKSDQAVAGIDGSTFLNCSASTLISKYRGESEKVRDGFFSPQFIRSDTEQNHEVVVCCVCTRQILRCLFDVARARAPSVVFIDEVRLAHVNSR